MKAIVLHMSGTNTPVLLAGEVFARPPGLSEREQPATSVSWIPSETGALVWHALVKPYPLAVRETVQEIASLLEAHTLGESI